MIVELLSISIQFRQNFIEINNLLWSTTEYQRTVNTKRSTQSWQITIILTF